MMTKRERQLERIRQILRDWDPIGVIDSLVGCIPGRLAYYYGEQGAERTILEKKVH